MVRWPLFLVLILATCTQVAHSVVEDSNNDLVIAMVVNDYDKYTQQDHYIQDGAMFFMRWCTDNGGFKYGNYTRRVRLMTRDGSAFVNQNATTVDAYLNMAPNSTLMMSPISTPRTQSALIVSEASKQILLAVGASADTLFNSGKKYMFSTVVPTSHIPEYSLSQFVGKAQNYVLFSTNDAVSISVTNSVLTYMNRSGIELLTPVKQLVKNSTNNAGLEGQINNFFQTHMQNITADLFVCTFTPDDFSFVASAFYSVQPNVKAAAYVLPLTRTVQKTKDQGKTGDYWVGVTQFDPSTPYGVSNEFGGTSQQFYNQFVTYFNKDPDPYAATASAALMSYYVAVKYAGTVDSDAVRQAMIDMPTFHSYLGDINFFPNGSSVYAKYLPFQFRNGSGAFITDAAPVVYPAIWPWVEQPLPIVKHSVPLSIALGVITGICICVALAALLLLVLRKGIFRKQGIVYCVLIIIGVLCTYAAALTTLPNPTDTLCLAFPWLLGIGFTLVFGCLFIKTWVLLQIFRSAEKLKKKKTLSLTVGYIVRLIVSAVLVEVIFMIVWSTVDPPKAELRTTLEDERQLMCTRSHPAFWAVFIAYKGLWLVAGVVVSVLTRNIREDYNESKNIVLAIYNCTVVMVVAVILAFILPKIPAAIILIQVVAILVAFTFALVVLFSTPFTHFVKGIPESEMRSATGASTMSAGSVRSNEAVSGGNASRGVSGTASETSA